MRVELGDRSYEIHIGNDWLPQLMPWLDFIPRTSAMMIITDAKVAEIAGNRVLELMRSGGFKVELAVFPGGEDHKNLTTVGTLTEKMVELGLDAIRRYSLGGGIPGDVTACRLHVL